MHSRTRIAILVAGAAVLAFGAGALATTLSEPSAPATADVQMTYGTDAAAPATPLLPGFATAVPSRGEVARIPGPFDDRFDLTSLAFDGKEVSGTLTVTSDVSELIDLEIVAGFYDADGDLLATESFVHHGEAHAHSGAPERSEDFEITAPARVAADVVSAVVGVPVLVNE